MLLEFRIRNFRSIKDEQSLSLVAAPADKELAETHLAPTGLKAPPQVVRSFARPCCTGQCQRQEHGAVCAELPSRHGGRVGHGRAAGADLQRPAFPVMLI